jgi:hypothetical protein
MSLSEEGRQQIYEEEKVRAEARERAENELNAKKITPRKVVGGCLTVLIVFPVGLAILSGIFEELTGTGSSKPATQQAEQKATQAPSEPETNNIIEVTYNNRKMKAACVDETVHLVEKVERRKRLGNEFFGETADGEFLIVRLVVRNDSKATRTIGATFMTVVDAKGHEFSTSSDGCMALSMSGDKTAELLLTEVQPGLEKKIAVVFDVPPGSKNLTLKVPSGLLDSPAYLPI